MPVASSGSSRTKGWHESLGTSIACMSCPPGQTPEVFPETWPVKVYALIVATVTALVAKINTVPYNISQINKRRYFHNLNGFLPP